MRELSICLFIATLLVFCSADIVGQTDPLRRVQGIGGGLARGGTGKGDSLQHRTGLEDSITITFRYIDTGRMQLFDSSIKDFTKWLPIPWHHVHLGNFGNATNNLLFHPVMQSGWDHGFHAYDAYNFTVPETRFYNTTRPYTEVGYMLGSISEQMIHLLHTQNIKPNWNAAFQFRLINSPGTYQNQNTNHNNYRVTSWYQSKNKRYQNFFVLAGNKLTSAENGGIRDEAFLDSSGYQDERYKIPVNIGGGGPQSRNFFSTSIRAGTFYTNAAYLFRQQYDVGQKDSLVVNDSTVVPLFYPRLRFEHTISYNTYKYRFSDSYADSSYYSETYKLTLPLFSDTIYRKDFWKELYNDFSIYTFPDAKNPQQFFKAGISFQTLKAEFDSSNSKFYGASYTNLFVHGEYRNKSRDRKWDIEAIGSFYINGLNSGDYHVHLSLKRFISKRIGYLKAGFENVNRKPSFVFDPLSSFYFSQPVSLNKENTTHIFGSLEQPTAKMKLSGGYYLLSNYSYFKNTYEPAQASSVFNVLHIDVEKEFRISKGWKWRLWLAFQQRIGDAEVNLPLLFARSQIAYDGNLGFKNLLLSAGFELRYFTPYKANGYASIPGQFYFQNEEEISLQLPEIAAYAHFRIRSFTLYARAENLNTLDLASFTFTRNNLVAPDYPYPGLQIRFGIFWTFVN